MLASYSPQARFHSDLETLASCETLESLSKVSKIEERRRVPTQEETDCIPVLLSAAIRHIPSSELLSACLYWQWLFKGE